MAYDTLPSPSPSPPAQKLPRGRKRKGTYDDESASATKTRTGWSSAVNAMLLDLIQEGHKDASIAASINKEYGLNKTPKAVKLQRQKLRHQAEADQWSPEEEKKLMEYAVELFAKKDRVTTLVQAYGAVKAQGPDGKQLTKKAIEAKIRKLKEEGKLDLDAL